jgi:D-amino-acid dehydrogenase
LRFIRECTPSRSRTNTLSKLRLARYSQQLMDELAAREGLQYWQTHAGVLYLFHDAAELEAAEQNSRLLIEHGRHQVVLDFAETVKLEPALGHSRTRFAGAIHDTSDGTGDPHLFAAGLAEVCRRLGDVSSRHVRRRVRDPTVRRSPVSSHPRVRLARTQSCWPRVRRARC